MRAHRKFARRWSRLVCCAAIAGLPVARDALAGSKVWVGTSGGWTEDARWSPFGRPGELDDVTINSSPNGVVVYFQVDGGQFHTYGNLAVSRMELRVQQSMGAAGLSLSGLTTSLLSVENGANAFIGSATVNANGLISITGNNSALHVTNLTQTAGLVTGSTTVHGTYLLNGGTFKETLTNEGTFNYSAGSFQSGALINNGTVIHNHPAAGMPVDVYNHGTILFNTDAKFLSFRNYASSTLPEGRNLEVMTFTYQRGGTFTQRGSVRTNSLSIGWTGGGAWEQHAGTLSVTGSQFAQGELTIGTNNGPNVGYPGTYRLHGGALRTDLVEVGSFFSAGTYEQSGGGVFISKLIVGNRIDSRGTFSMSGGTFLAGSVELGRDDAAAGTILMSGGTFSVGSANLNGLVHVTDGTFQTSVGGGALPLANHGLIRQSGGFTNFGPIDGAGRIDVTGNGSMSAGRIRQHAVHLGGDGKIVASSPMPVTHVVPLLSFDESAGAVHGTWDLGDGALVVDYDGASPAATIRRYLRSGYASGDWSGTGLSSSEAHASAGTAALGYAEASQILGASGGMFGGVLVDGSAVLVRYTRYGDANLDGVVNLSDFNRLAANFGGSGTGWGQADFNYDGVVNLSDFNRLAANFGLSAAGPEVTAQDWARLASAVPEPTALGLTAVAAAGYLIARQRRRA